MRESIGSVFLYNMIIVFIVVVFAFLAATVSYYKAFKVNTLIITSIEKYEGYNTLAINDISRNLDNIGYTMDLNSRCPRRDNREPMMVSATNRHHYYCVYQYNEGNYYVYGVVSYISIDIPMFGQWIKIPIFTKTGRIYKLG